MEQTRIIQNAIPTRYDPLVTVTPCETARFPHLPLDILYQVARALPQPKQVFNLALASKETWEYLQPALFECEVTYESRLAHQYGGGSSTSLEQHYGNYEPPTPTASSVEDGSWGDSDSGSDHYGRGDWYNLGNGFGIQSSDEQHENDLEDSIQSNDDQHTYDWEDYVQNDDDQSGYDWEDYVQNHNDHNGYDSEDDIQSDDYDQSAGDLSTEASCFHPESRPSCHGASIFGECDKCDGRISLQNRTFEAPMPKIEDPIRIEGAMTALHWAAKKGASALPVAQRAIRSALAHQPSYINGVGLQERLLCDPVEDDTPRYIPADLPPPLFLAIAHGNFEVFNALLDAGCATNLLQGQAVCGWRCSWRKSSMDPIMSFKIHEECMEVERRVDPCVCEWKLYYGRDDYVQEEPRICQSAGHIAIRYEQPEMLKVLLLNGLNVQPPQPASLHLAQFAVRRGSLACLKVLLDLDPSLTSSYLNGETILESVRFMGQNAERDVRDRLMRNIVSFLLQHGAVLDARTCDRVPGGRRRENWDQSGLTALQTALLFPLRTVIADPKLFTSLHAAEVFISMGASWEQRVRPVRPDSPRFPGIPDPDYIMPLSLEKAVEKLHMEMWHVEGQGRDHFDETNSERVNLRAAWGQVFTTIVETARESLTNGSSQNKAAVESALSSTFARLVNRWSRSVANGEDWCWPSAAKGAGRLLLSTGITPSDADLKEWRTLNSGEDMRG